MIGLDMERFVDSGKYGFGCVIPGIFLVFSIRYCYCW